MITKEKLLEDLGKSMDKSRGGLISDPRRCVLNNYEDYPNVIGYFVEFDPEYVYEPASIFIADKPNRELFHRAYSVLHGNIFNDRCVWLYEQDVIMVETEGFYI